MDIALVRSWTLDVESSTFALNSDSVTEDTLQSRAIVWGTDARNVEPLVACVHSVMKHWRGTPPEIFVLAWQVGEEQSRAFLDWMQRVHPTVNVKWIDAGSYALPDGAGHVSAATYLRFLIPELVPADRVLYLDTDILARGDLSLLLKMELDGAAIGAVVDDAVVDVKHLIEGGLFERYGLKAGAAYFNAGVLVMDVNLWRKRGLAEALKRGMAEFAGRTPLSDQDVLNVLLHDQWKALDSGWNYQVGGLMVRQQTTVADVVKRWLWAGQYGPMRQAKLLHFTGPLKPWNGGLRTLGTGEYVKALREAGWISRRQGWGRLKGALRRTFGRT